MERWESIARKSERGWLALGGVQITGILSAELFAEAGGPAGLLRDRSIAALCHDRWTDLADGLAALSVPAEVYLILGYGLGRGHNEKSVNIMVLACGRANDSREARRLCEEQCRQLWLLLSSILDYAELEPVNQTEILDEAWRYLNLPQVTEVRRRYEPLTVSHGVLTAETVGFIREDRELSPDEMDEAQIKIQHLFPWVPSDDNWHRLLEALSGSGPACAFAVHVRGWDQAPASCTAEVRSALAAAERASSSRVSGPVDTILRLQADVLRQELLRRLSVLQGRVIAAQVFVTSSEPPTPALLATVKGCIDDASCHSGTSGAESLFRSGARLLASSPTAVLAELPGDEADLLFCPREAAAVLRTPMPPIGEMPGLAVNRARTAPMLGSAGTDCPLGANIHRNRRQQVSLDADMRFRHTYLVGQTGTGKSTLLLHMILHDINQNRGVAVLDPHGTLIEQILRLYPRSREDDLIIVDVTDFERPVPFNVLRIQETDPLAYRVARDIIIDDIFAYLERTYDMKLVGGPIFETHFRGMLGLLLGLEPQRAPFIPNLMIFRSLYQNTELRQALTKRIGNRDISMEEFIDEITNARGDHEIRNLAQYITAKFNRFVSDISLRNITCQNEILDLEALVEKGKVLLFYLGKGRFGDVAAGLLASQIVSRLRSVVMKRGARAGARPFYLYADEFHMFADERFGELLAEARKFGLSLTIAHQYARQIPEKILMGILGNVGTVISFRVGPPDAQMLEPLFRPQLTARDLSSLPNFRAYIRSFGRLGQTPFSLEPPPPPGNGCDELAANLRQLSRYRHGRDRSLVEEEIAATYKAYKEFERGRFFV